MQGVVSLALLLFTSASPVASMMPASLTRIFPVGEGGPSFYRYIYLSKITRSGKSRSANLASAQTSELPLASPDPSGGGWIELGIGAFLIGYGGVRWRHRLLHPSHIKK